MPQSSRHVPTTSRLINWQVRRDSNPQPSVLETDALPIELLTYEPLLRFLVRRVLATEPAVLAHLDPFRRLFLVLGAGVVAALALTARERNVVPHGLPCQ